MRSTIINFYNEDCRHIGSNLLLSELLDSDDDRLSRIHGYMHWLFPLRKPSDRYGGPTLTEEELLHFRQKKDLRIKYLKSFARILQFFGFIFEDSEKGMRIVVSTDTKKRQETWLYNNSPYYNSIARILQSLMLLGFEDLANSFLEVLTLIYVAESPRIGKMRYTDWKNSVSSSDYWNSSA